MSEAKHEWDCKTDFVEGDEWHIPNLIVASSNMVTNIVGDS